MMNKESSLIIHPIDLPRETTQLIAQQLPQHLVDFKQYVDSKFCYNSAPLKYAELVRIDRKYAYQCQIRILMETRHIRTRREPHPWKNSILLLSTTLGRLFEERTRGGQPVGDIWNDYQFPIPPSDQKTKQELALPQCTFQSRCDKCHGKCTENCNADGCRRNDRVCSKCGGSGKVLCSECKGRGGFRNIVSLISTWSTHVSVFTLQNSFLPDEHIGRAKRTLFWTHCQVPWSEELAIDQFAQALHGEPQLQAKLMQQYMEKHLNPNLNVDNRMRRIICIIERLDFEEISYTLGDKYVDKRDSTKKNIFHFCQYPINDRGGRMIYEDDYPLNVCGCCGEKCACHCCCCSIL